MNIEKIYTDVNDMLPEYMDVFSSQEGEDILIRRLLKSRYNNQGVYVDIGALHPFRFSTTAHFYMRGWKGVNIEPNSDVIGLFRELRPRDVNLSYAVGRAGIEEYYRFVEPAFNTFDSAQVEYALSKTSLIEKVKIEKKPLSIIFDEYLLNEIAELVFFNIDVEGNELEVLETNDWSKYRPLLLLVEALSEEKYLELKEFLERYDYHFVARTKNTYFFAEAVFKKEFVD